MCMEGYNETNHQEEKRAEEDLFFKKQKDKLHEILDLAIRVKASDIHLTNNLVPTIRLDGTLRGLSKFAKNTPYILAAFAKVLLNQDQQIQYEKEKDIDLSISHGLVRFRVHIYRQSESDAIALRIIPRKIPSFSEMNIPTVLKEFTKFKNGLVLITGVTGSGKSTTLAAIIDEINRSQSKNIITVEDPIEFIHSHNKSIVNQREVGVDVQSFSRAVRAAMREDPDILLVGELRDLETIHNAITMAETGHLVFGTLHTKSVSETIDRIVDVFPPIQQEQIRVQLSNSIAGIVCQDLLPKVGGGRVPSCEIMITNPAIRSLIKEGGNASAFTDNIFANHREIRTQTKLQAIAKLVHDKLITDETAYKNIKEDEIEMLQKIVASM